jgi:very-short-patch-repair endonuclease
MDWRDLARLQAGAVSRTQLARSGLSAAEMDGLVERRELITLLPCVYTPRPVPASTAQAEWAAVLWSGGVLSHRSAARWWRLPVDAPPVVHVTVGDRRFRPRTEQIRIHRVALDPAECTSASGLAITSRRRTLVDLMRSERYGVARDVRDRALQQGWLDANAIRASVNAQFGRTGNTQLRRLLTELEPAAHAESERLLHSILRRGRMTGWRPQFRVRLNRRVVYIDVAFPERRLALEVDGRRYHGDESARFEDDRLRQNELIAAGWRVLRFTWAMLVDQPDQVLAQIVQLLAA